MHVHICRGIGLLGIGAIWLAVGQNPGGSIPPGTTRYNLVVPVGLPVPPILGDNPLTVQGVALGQRLFGEKRLSGNNTQACLDCHKPADAFSDGGKAVSVGSTGIKGTRNAPALFNLAYQHAFFWDGRSASLRAQALVPIQNPIEMNQTLTAAVQKLSSDSTYVSQFAKAFGSTGITAARIGLALEQYENTLLAGSSKFDQVQLGRARFTALEQQGFNVFRTPFNPQQRQFGGDCARCHGGPLLSDFAFRNNGLDADPKDPGLEGFTLRAGDFAKFKTPSLRNLTVTGPYMHDGRFQTLAQVVEHYSTGIQRSATLDPGLAREPGGVDLSPADKQALIAFLQTLVEPQYVNSTPVP
jgi:cytochrome c peroxidase